VAGIGEKTAAALLASYESLDGVYAHLEQVSASVRKKLEAGKQSAYLSQELARIVTDLDVRLDLQQARPDQFDPPRVEAIFRELEFRMLMERLTRLEEAYGKRPSRGGQQLSMFGEAAPAPRPGTSDPVIQSKEIRTRLVDSAQALEELAARLQAAKMIAFDTETTSTDPMRAELVGISLAVEPGEGYYIPVGHRSGQQLELQAVMRALSGPLTDGSIPKAGHNAKYDWIMLKRAGLEVQPVSFDSMIAEWVINPASRNLGLKNLAWVRQGIQMTNIEELLGKGKNQRTMAEVPVEQAAAYAAADAAVVLRLELELHNELRNTGSLELFNDIEMPLLPILAEMEMAGISLDTPYLTKMSDELSQRLGEIEQQVYQAVGEKFNLNSPQQLSEALFGRLGLDPPDRTARTATGFYSTSADVLEAMRGSHPAVDWVLEYRELSKLKSTYLDALPQQVNPLTGRVHTSYNQTGSVTGRLASSEPNLQNIPIRTELGRQVRNGFVAASDSYLLSVDYSQVELRIAAHMSGDQAMLDTFAADLDIHTATAAAIYGVPLEAVTREQRRNAKSINFGLIYGMSAYGLTRASDLTLAEAEDFVEAYFKQFPGVKRYLDNMRKLAAEQGYVETLLGRKRYFPGLKNQTGDRNQRNREEREAINAPIQGTAADIMKIAMLHLPAALQKAGLSGQMLLQVHDELVLEAPQAELQATARVVREVMETAYDLKAPLRTEARYGRNWGEMTAV
jgi:DNA polymerase-1